MKTASLHKQNEEKITFSFGANWQDYLRTVAEASIQSARTDIEKWLGTTSMTGETVLDIGCGSGVHSLVFCRMGARRILSMDVDPLAVEATRTLRRREGEPRNWEIIEGSILDEALSSGLGVFDTVYAWGVLHHTGALWEALENACRLVAPGGRLWLALYAEGPNYERDLRIKKEYNASSGFGKKIMVYHRIGQLMWRRLRGRQNPLRWNQKKERGMNVYHDIIDWLGGLPYEVAHPERVTQFLCERGFVRHRIELFPEGCNHIYLFARDSRKGNV